MLKLFFIIFFIAELIITLSLIFKIHSIDKSVNKLNNSIEKNKIKILFLFKDIRYVIEEFNSEFIKFRKILVQKQQKYLMMVLKNTAIFSSLFLLRGKWKKYRRIFLSYQLLKEFYEGFAAVKNAV